MPPKNNKKNICSNQKPKPKINYKTKKSMNTKTHYKNSTGDEIPYLGLSLKSEYKKNGCT